jgi:ADP-heptose:LPS heptosyltransferase
MTFRQRILVDRLIAVPLAVALNAIVRLMGKILGRDHSIRPETTREIAVCKLVGMGSMLQATPLLVQLKHRFPQARLVFVTLRGNADLAHRLDGVDEVLSLDDRGAWLMLSTTVRLLAILCARHVDLFFDLEVYSGFTCLLSLFSLARNRLGLYRHSNRFKKGIYTHLVYFNTRMPVRKIYLQLGRLAGLPAGTTDALLPPRIEPTEVLALEKKLTGLGLAAKTPFLLVNPNASDLMIERRWPREYFATVVNRVAEAGWPVVLTGSRGEAGFVNSLLETIPTTTRTRVFNTAGMLALGELLALISSAASVLTNDTGPMHMAFALGRPVVCLVGPADPVHIGMEGPNIVTLYAQVSCSPCVHEVDEPPCHGNNVCMKRLLPELVVDKLLALLAQQKPDSKLVPPASTRLQLAWEDDSGEPLGVFQR